MGRPLKTKSVFGKSSRFRKGNLDFFLTQVLHTPPPFDDAGAPRYHAGGMPGTTGATAARGGIGASRGERRDARSGSITY